MSNDKKTIGPMTLDRDDDWELGPYGFFLCGMLLGEYFNIPNTAKKLWVTLTKRCPKYDDAIRVSFDYFDRVTLDNNRAVDVYFTSQTLREAMGFGNNFYATIHYA